MLNLSPWLNHSGYFNQPTTASITKNFFRVSLRVTVRHDRIIAPRLALYNLCRGYSILCNLRKEERNYRTEQTGYVASEINLFHNNEVLREEGCTSGFRADM
jgi:hypothetical protein